MLLTLKCACLLRILLASEIKYGIYVSFFNGRNSLNKTITFYLTRKQNKIDVF